MVSITAGDKYGSAGPTPFSYFKSMMAVIPYCLQISKYSPNEVVFCPG